MKVLDRHPARAERTRAVRLAPVAVDEVAVVALLAGLDEAVPAGARTVVGVDGGAGRQRGDASIGRRGDVDAGADVLVRLRVEVPHERTDESVRREVRRTTAERDDATI